LGSNLILTIAFVKIIYDYYRSFFCPFVLFFIGHICNMVINPMQPVITIKEVMELLYNKYNKTPFSLTFVSLDFNRNKGGDIIRLENCLVPRASFITQRTNSEILTSKHKPNHLINNTINVAIGATDRLVKIHIDLITEFNNKRVIW